MANLTVEQGIQIQSRQLEEWKMVLNRKSFTALKKYAVKDNHKAVTGFDITRGTDFSNFIANYSLQLFREKYH